MKQSRFIELLNLYVDHQLTKADAAELEAEIMRDPARRRTYQQYCRMQRACRLLFEREQSEAPASLAAQEALAAADRKIVAFPGDDGFAGSRRSLYAGLAGATAIAACAAFVFFGANRQGGEAFDVGPMTVAAISAEKPTASTAMVTPVAAVAPVGGNFSGLHVEFSPVFRSHFLTLVQAAAESESASPALSEQPTFDWLEGVQLSPLQRQRATVQDLAFERRPAVIRTEAQRFLGTRNPTHEEITVLQFQR